MGDKCLTRRSCWSCRVGRVCWRRDPPALTGVLRPADFGEQSATPTSEAVGLARVGRVSEDARGQRLPLAARPLGQPHPARLAVNHSRRAEILAAHASALAADEAGYADPETGLFVLTAGFLARRGTCCGRGCRHCPYLDDD